MGAEHKEGVLERTPRPGVCDDQEPKSEYHEELTASANLAAAQAPDKKDRSRVTEATSEEPASRLFSTEEAARFRSRWETIQTGFVDEPHLAVKQADGLVTEVINRLTQIFADERAKLEAQLDHNHELSTEDLRLALRHYRTFFGRLLSI